MATIIPPTTLPSMGLDAATILPPSTVVMQQKMMDIENQHQQLALQGGNSSGEHARLLDGSSAGVDATHPHLRLAFLRRVFMLLSLQLVVTIAIAHAFMFLPPIQSFCVEHSQALTWGTFVSTFGTLLGLGPAKHHFPLNLLLLTLFTLLESCFIGTICAIYYANGAGLAIGNAALLTLTVFFMLTIYCMTSKRDFSFSAGFLFSCFFNLLGWGLMSALLGLELAWIYSAVGAAVICGLILLDVHFIMQQYGLDDYVGACITLYLDIINLFVFVLQLFTASGRD